VKYVISPAAASPVVPNASAYIAAGGQQAATLMCRLAAAEIALPQAKLRELYRNPKNYVSMVEKRVAELEKAGWSLPVYRDVILADAAKVKF
jgi:hypothetical protein